MFRQVSGYVLAIVAASITVMQKFIIPFITAYKLLAVQHKQTAVDKDSGILDGKKKSARPGVRHECHVNHVTMH